jgi:hypothetical protein
MPGIVRTTDPSRLTMRLAEASHWESGDQAAREKLGGRSATTPPSRVRIWPEVEIQRPSGDQVASIVCQPLAMARRAPVRRSTANRSSFFLTSTSRPSAETARAEAKCTAPRYHSSRETKSYWPSTPTRRRP